MAMHDEIKEQTEKLKDMDSKQKREYIWTYYKWYFIIGAFLIATVISVIAGIIRNSVPIYVDVTFLNSDLSYVQQDDFLAEDFAAALGINLDENRVMIDYTCYLNNDYSNQASYTTQMKLVSRYSAEEIDICVGPENVMMGSGDPGGYKDYSEWPTELTDKLAEKGYEIFYYTEKEYDDYPDADGITHYTEIATYPAGIYIDKCDKLLNVYGVYSADTVNDEELGRMVLTISYNAPHPENAAAFVDFITD